MTISPAVVPSGAEAAEWVPEGPYALAGTIRTLQCGAGDPSFISQGPNSWLAFRTTDGPVTLLLRQRGGLNDARVQATAWGLGAAAALQALPRLLGADDDWAAFDTPEFRDSLPDLARKGRYLNPGLRLPASGRMLDTVARAVLEQKVTGLEAKRAWRYLLLHHGDAAPGAGEYAPAGLRLPPTAEQWRRVPSWDWHRAGVDSKRSATILKAALVASGLERLAVSSGAPVHAGLRSVPGIGVWTVAEVVQRTHGCPDSISVGDYHLAAYVGAALTGRRTDDAGMIELLKPWKGHRQRVVRSLYGSGFRKQAFGPRLTPEDHRRR
ncbi:3-methyladenine DNA glycosylase [Arthrobacter sp. RIT-PI-e]|uniref:DNA-3-methyladenine glycosylase family protein n=1 Tax=Arthrobacter sp. RIT-PI-e TaxID=1681197 RepID=UPI00067649EF|nr:3-methyladenine DNA glycosylase [Arthrobacter sp. RIT-PI-e]KNC19410.1 3-methyladenine DNA glycosylase [Arthrobacter sp. RIT-PI-e]